MSKILTISSQVVYGHVGNSAIQFSLQRLGFEVFAIPTVLLGHHKGYEREPFTVNIPEGAISGLAGDLTAMKQLPSCPAIMTGYAAGFDVLSEMIAVVAQNKIQNPGLIYLCDPILGDEGRLYVDEPIAAGIRDALVPGADIITPNLFELGWLTGTGPETPEDVIDAARSLAAPRVLVTSAPAKSPDKIATMLVTANTAHIAETPLLENPPHGAGDLMAALFLGCLLKGQSDDAALASAVASVHDVIELSVSNGSDRLALVEAQNSLIDPQTRISVTSLH